MLDPWERWKEWEFTHQGATRCTMAGLEHISKQLHEIAEMLDLGAQDYGPTMPISEIGGITDAMKGVSGGLLTATEVATSATNEHCDDCPEPATHRLTSRNPTEIHNWCPEHFKTRFSL